MNHFSLGKRFNTEFLRLHSDKTNETNKNADLAPTRPHPHISTGYRTMKGGN